MLISRQIYFITILFTIFYFITNGYAENRGKHTSYLFITVDTESLTRQDFPLTKQLGTSIDGTKAGIDRIISIADRYNAKITFYFNIYEFRKLRESGLKRILNYILEKGHDIELHTDQPLTEGHDRYLNTYSLEEQKKIIKKGRDLLYKWTGLAPVAHRAGTYAANNDTIKAILYNDIYIDSSYFYKHRRNKLNPDEFNINAVTLKGKLLEIPVTVFYVNEFTNLLGIKMPGISRLKKLDLDSCNLDLLKKVTIELVKNRIDTIVLFMHSWSLVKKWDGSGEKGKADIMDIGEFDKYLSFLSSIPEIEIISTRDYWERYKKNEISLSSIDFVPTIDTTVDLLTYIRRKLNIHRGNYQYWIISLSIVLLILVTFALILLNRRKKW